MSERIDSFEERPDAPGTTLFLDGPSEFLVSSVVDLLAATEQWAAIFGDFMDPYKRMDYPERALPALRVYNESYVKQFDSWFIEGDLKVDVILPGSIRRKQTQRVQDGITAAMLQQFRRPRFFEEVSAIVPGLNELGKTFQVDKSLGFQSDDNSDIVPMTQITVNFRIDLRIWDSYLESSARTKDDPFEETLADLSRIASTIQGLRDDDQLEVTVPVDQKV